MSAPTLPYLDLLPLFLLVGGGALMMLVDALVPRAERWLGWIAAAACLGALVGLAMHPTLGEDGTGTLAAGSIAWGAFGTLVVLGALGAILIAMPYLRAQQFLRGEFFALVLFSASGGLLLAGARNFVLLFLALEILTVPLYVLAGFWRVRRTAVEASVKYFLVGIFSSAFLLYGIALWYGAVGTLDLFDGADAMAADPALASSWLVRLSMALVVVGIGFKVAAVPFHFWAPDVYQGAPTPVTAYLAVGSKAGGFAFAWKVLTVGFLPAAAVWTGLVTWLAIATLVLGALLALLQEDVKRLLAYSSVAHAGYALIALIAQGRMEGMGIEAEGAGPSGTLALLLYLLIYAVTALGAFGAVSWVERSYGGPLLIDDYRGLARRNPLMAALLAFLLLSLAGIPPTAGFVGKFVLFWSAVRASAWPVAVVGVLTAVIGLYYYLSIVVAMYFRPTAEDQAVPVARPAPALALTIGFSAVLVAVLGVWPAPILGLLQRWLG